MIEYLKIVLYVLILEVFLQVMKLGLKEFSHSVKTKNFNLLFSIFVEDLRLLAIVYLFLVVASIYSIN